MYIKTLLLQNFRVFQNATMTDIPAFSVVVGASGAGKSVLLDAFAFLQDCLQENVCAALEKRGGFHEVVSRGHDEERIVLELRCRLPLHGTERLTTYRMVTYRLEIACQDRRPFVAREVLRSRNGARGPLLSELDFSRGQGKAQSPAFAGEDKQAFEEHVLATDTMLALGVLGQEPRFAAAHALYRAMADWPLASFLPAALKKACLGEASSSCAMARSRRFFGADSLVHAARHLQEHEPRTWEEVVRTMRGWVPGLDSISVQETEDGRAELLFGSTAFATPFGVNTIGDGTLLILAWLVLLHAPRPRSFLGADAPERHLYPRLLAYLVEEFRRYGDKGGQVMLSSQSPQLLNAVELDEVFWLEKGASGFTRIVRARDNSQVATYMKNGDRMGLLWQQGFFGRVDPS